MKGVYQMKRTQFCEDWFFSEVVKPKEKITLPHDAMLQQGRAQEAATGTGGAFFLGGTYEYSKTFWAPQAWENQLVMLEFEGVYPHAHVFLNGKEVGSCQYGYSLFRVTLADFNYEAENQLTVKVDNSQLPNSRWYSGAGIYRPVWLLTSSRAHVEPDGIRVTTLGYQPAEISVDVAYQAADVSEVEVVVEIFDEGQKVAEQVGTKNIQIANAKLWSAETPHLYDCRVTLRTASAILDQQTARFGIRQISWSKSGLFVNGKSVLLKGGCIHHDNGILGARSYAESEYRRIKRLKEFGFNAIRSSHNPLCVSALDACDELGMYVMDETWDMWDVAKNPYDYAQDFKAHYAFDLASLVAKDYNHPSVILYSIANEITEPGKPEGLALADAIIQKLKQLDATRPITAGINLTLLFLSTLEKNPLDASDDVVAESQKMNSTAYNQMVYEMGNRMTMVAATPQADEVSQAIFDRLDIAGYNYAVSRYDEESQKHPDRLVIGTETYTYDLATVWPKVEKYPYLLGDFMWTAWDYLGEVGIGSWSYDTEDMGFNKTYPWLLSGAGAFDILGNDTAIAGAAAVIWGQRTTPYIGVCPVNHPGVVPTKAIWRGSNALPYWSYKGCEGNLAEIEVYTTAARVELFLNEECVATAPVEDFKAVFHTNYHAGTLKAVAYDQKGQIHSESQLQSADAQTQIRVQPETNTFQVGDIVYLAVDLTGENGEIECNRDTFLHVSVAGGELLAFGSANPKTEESFISGGYTTYYGRSQAVIRIMQPTVQITVKGAGLQTVTSCLTTV